MKNTKEKWKKEIEKRYYECMEITEIAIAESQIVMNEHNTRRTLTWHEELEKAIRPFFLDCPYVYTYQYQFQDEQRKSYAVEFSFQEGDAVYLMTISFSDENHQGYLYYKDVGKRGFQVLNKDSIPTKVYPEKPEYPHFKTSQRSEREWMAKWWGEWLKF